jgi:hypothetical protein
MSWLCLGGIGKIMKLLNFELASTDYPIELEGLGRSWDLHNQAEFLRAIFDPLANTVVMEWFIGPGTPYSALKLLFANVKSLRISPRDEEMPPTEDYCLSYIAKVAPRSIESHGYRLKREWKRDDPFHLFFEFHSGRTVEIDSETVQLIGVPR